MSVIRWADVPAGERVYSSRVHPNPELKCGAAVKAALWLKLLQIKGYQRCVRHAAPGSEYCRQHARAVARGAGEASG